MTKSTAKSTAKPAPAPVAPDRRLEPKLVLALIIAFVLGCLAYAYLPTDTAQAGIASPTLPPVQRVVVEVHVVQQVAPAPVHHAHRVHHCTCH
jgi:hypothetical protein